MYRIKITIPNANIEISMNTEFIDILKVCIDNFHKDKVPMNIGKQRYDISVL